MELNGKIPYEALSMKAFEDFLCRHGVGRGVARNCAEKMMGYDGIIVLRKLDEEGA